MAPTTRSTRSGGKDRDKDKVSQLTDKGTVGKRTAKPKPSDRKAALQNDIERLERQIQSGTGNAQELEPQLEMRRAEYQELEDMDVDSPDSESQENPLDGPTEGTNNGVAPNGSNPATGSKPDTPEGILVKQETIDELTEGVMNLAVTSRDSMQTPEAWRWRLHSKLVTMRYGPLGACKYAVVSGKIYDTEKLQHLSEPLNFRNQELKKVYALDNVAGYNGIVIYGNYNCDLRVCWHGLTGGVPDDLHMVNNCSWVTRTELRYYFKKAGLTDVHLWQKMKEIWEAQEKNYAGYKKDYTIQSFPIPQPLPSTKKGSGASRRGRRKSPAADPGHATDATRAGSVQGQTSESPAVAGTSRTGPAVPQEQRSSDSFVLQAGPQTTTPKSENITFNKKQYVNDMLKAMEKEQGDVKALAKIHAAYDIYKAEMLKEGAIEVGAMGTSETPAIKRESQPGEGDEEC